MERNDRTTLIESCINFVIRLGWFIRVFGRELQPDYWVYMNCGHVEHFEREVMCWKCGIGEMIYKGDLS